MTKTWCLRMSMDITMTILSVILMGGNFLFPAEIVHEILGLGFARIAHLLASHWYYLFAMDYISIIILFATISHFIAKLLKKRFN